MYVRAYVWRFIGTRQLRPQRRYEYASRSQRPAAPEMTQVNARDTAVTTAEPQLPGRCRQRADRRGHRLREHVEGGVGEERP